MHSSWPIRPFWLGCSSAFLKRIRELNENPGVVDEREIELKDRGSSPSPLRRPMEYRSLVRQESFRVLIAEDNWTSRRVLT
jgi:hypothetical protein